MIQVEAGTITLSAVALILISAFLGYSFAIRRVKFQEKHKAAIEFKKAITPALDNLENGENQFKVIQDSFDNHYKAAILFSAHLKGRDLDLFKRALGRYKHWQNTMYGRSREEVMYDTEDPEYLEAKSINPAQLIQDLLRYANT